MATAADAGHTGWPAVISLIGYRGVGKSATAQALGQALAAAAGGPQPSVVDTDDLVVRRAGCSIAAVFAQAGEPEFRRLESAALADLLSARSPTASSQMAETDPPLIIATGGGLVLAEANRKWLSAAGPVIWLTARPETIVQRITGDAHSAVSRPALTGRSVTDEVASVLEFRRPIYRDLADFSVETDDSSPESVAKQIVEWLSSRHG